MSTALVRVDWNQGGLAVSTALSPELLVVRSGVRSSSRAVHGVFGDLGPFGRIDEAWVRVQSGEGVSVPQAGGRVAHYVEMDETLVSRVGRLASKPATVQ